MSGVHRPICGIGDTLLRMCIAVSGPPLPEMRRLVAAKDVGKFLLTLDDVEFWNPVLFPEFTELRALRFSDLDEEARHSVLGRLKKGAASQFVGTEGKA